MNLIQTHQTSPTVSLTDIPNQGAGTEVHGKYSRSRAFIGTEIIKQVETLFQLMETDKFCLSTIKVAIGNLFLLEFNFFQFSRKSAGV